MSDDNSKQHLFYVLMYAMDLEYLGYIPVMRERIEQTEDEDTTYIDIKQEILQDYVKRLQAAVTRNSWMYLNKKYPIDDEDDSLVDNTSDLIAIKPEIVAVVMVEDSGMDVFEVIYTSSKDESDVALDIPDTSDVEECINVN